MTNATQSIPPNSRTSEPTLAARPDQAASTCCGGPAPASADACCALDADVKAAGGAGCGCGGATAAAPAPAPSAAKKGCCA